MIYQQELKEKVKKELINESVNAISKKYGISQSTLYKWKKEPIAEPIKESVKTPDSNIENLKSYINEVSNHNLNINYIQSQVKKLVQKKHYHEAIKIIDSLPLKHYQLDIQKASILYKIGTLNSLLEAKRIYEMYSEDNTYLNEFYNKILTAIEKKQNNIKRNSNTKTIPKIERKPEKEIENEEVLKSLLTKLYCNVLTLDEISNSNINDYEKVILTVGYYEKVNKKSGIKYTKEKKKEYQDEPNRLKVINFLTERLINNRIQIFDITTYGKILGVTIDGYKAIEIFNDVKQKETQVAEIHSSTPKPVINTSSREIKKVKEKPKSVIISCKGTNVRSRHQNNSNNNVVNNITTNIVLIKDVFKDEILEIGMYLYLKMQNLETRGISTRAWDNLEALINKPITDKIALEKMINIIKKIEELSILDIEYNENNVKKFLNKSK